MLVRCTPTAPSHAAPRGPTRRVLGEQAFSRAAGSRRGYVRGGRAA
jgi:hypothetical protein